MPMTAYLVTVRPGEISRYLDSIWISKESAERRASCLKGEFSREGKDATFWRAFVSESLIEDATDQPQRAYDGDTKPPSPADASANQKGTG